MLSYEGCADFRMRLTAATLSGKSLKVKNIRSQGSSSSSSSSSMHHGDGGEMMVEVGLQDYEANYLRLLDEISDGKLAVFHIYMMKTTVILSRMCHRGK
jgi:hypothetical protein